MHQKKNHPYMFLKTKDAIKETQNFTTKKYILLIHSPEELNFEMQQSHLDQKIAAMKYN